jgi:hypothetical protein
LEEVYPPGILAAKSAAAAEFYRKAAAVHGENLELILKYQAILEARWRRLKDPTGESASRIRANADATHAALMETIQIIASLNAPGYVAVRWQRAMYDAWISLFEPAEEELIEGPIRITA